MAVRSRGSGQRVFDTELLGLVERAHRQLYSCVCVKGLRVASNGVCACACGRERWRETGGGMVLPRLLGLVSCDSHMA